MNCRACNANLNDGMDLFIHNLLERCNRDAAIEFMEITANNREEIKWIRN